MISSSRSYNDPLSAKTDLIFAVFDKYVSKLSDNMIMIAAVVVTAAVCIAGMYLLTSGGDDKEKIKVAVSSDISDPGSFFEEFNENARANVQIVTYDEISSIEMVRALLFDDGMAAVMTSEDFSVPSDIEMITIGDSIYVFCRSGDTEGMTGFFINWLHTQA